MDIKLLNILNKTYRSNLFLSHKNNNRRNESKSRANVNIVTYGREYNGKSISSDGIFRRRTRGSGAPASVAIATPLSGSRVKVTSTQQCPVFHKITTKSKYVLLRFL